MALVPALRRLPALELLSFMGNSFGEVGLAALVAPPPPPADALLPPTRVLAKLKELHLNDTQVTDAGCIALASAISSGALTALEEFDLSHTHSGVGARTTVHEALEKRER